MVAEASSSNLFQPWQQHALHTLEHAIMQIAGTSCSAHLEGWKAGNVWRCTLASNAQQLGVHELLALQRWRQQASNGPPHLSNHPAISSSAATSRVMAQSEPACSRLGWQHRLCCDDGLLQLLLLLLQQDGSQGRTSSSKGASGMSRLPFTPPLFLMAVRTSSSDSSLQSRCASDRAGSHKRVCCHSRKQPRLLLSSR